MISFPIQGVVLASFGMRPLFFYLNTILVSLFYCSLPLVLFFVKPRSRLFCRLQGQWAAGVAWGSGVPVEVMGLENIRPNQAYVIAANHQSLLDLPFLYWKIPLYKTVIAKKELFRIPLFGWAMALTGVLSVDRSNREKAIQTIQQAEEILRKGEISLLVFPEGTRTRDGQVQRFKKGSFYLAVRSGLPILPVTVSGCYESLPKQTLWLRSGHKIRIQIHPEISVDGRSTDDTTELAARTQEVVAAGLKANYNQT